MSTHSTLHLPQTSPSEPANSRRRLTWHFGPATPSTRGGWQAVAEITSPDRFAGLRQWGHGGTRDEALAQLRQLVDSFETMVGVDYEPAPRLSPAEQIIRAAKGGAK